MDQNRADQLWQDDRNWKKGVYRCQEDPRIVVPKRAKWAGWTINFAHPGAVPLLLSAIVMAVSPGIYLLKTKDMPGFLILTACVIIVITAMSVILSKPPRKQNFR